MKKPIFTTFLLGLAIALHAQDSTYLKTWNFTSVPVADVAAITADSSWTVDSKSRYCYTPALTAAPAMANGVALQMTDSMLFTIPANSSGNLRLGGSTASLWLGDACSMIIPSCAAGKWIEVEYMTSKNTATRQLTTTNLVSALPPTTGKTHVVAQSQVAGNGDVILTVPGGMYFYRLLYGDSLAIFGNGGSGGGSVSPGNPDNPQDTLHSFNIRRNLTALHQTILGNGPVIYVSPTGNDNLSGHTPDSALLSIQEAVNRAVEPGTTIVLAAGEYRPQARINIDNRNGTHDNYNAMVCLDGRAVIRCDHPYHSHSDNPYQGVRLTSSYWYFYHIDITNASDNGMLIERNKPSGGSSADVMAATDQAHDNIIEACHFYRNGDTGLQMKNLASYNYVINCDSYLNCDEDEGDADGFAPKISVGTGNYFFGCRAFLNSDDGWDVFYKRDGNFGDDMTIIMDNCISYKNGFLSADTIAPSGNGNGFKCGSDQGAMNVYLNRCLAVCNKAKGFDQNHNSGDIIMNNCTGITYKAIVGEKAYSYRIYETIDANHRVQLTNCIAINDNDSTDKRDKTTGLPKPGENGKYGQYGRFEVDTTLAGLTVTNCEFHKAKPSLFADVQNHAQLMAARDSLDQLPEITFAHLLPTSLSLIDQGVPVNDTIYRSLPVLPVAYAGAAPDLGAYESGVQTPTDVPVVQTQDDATTASVRRTIGGMLILSVADSDINLSHSFRIWSVSGQLLRSGSFLGGSVAVYLPGAETVVVEIR